MKSNYNRESYFDKVDESKPSTLFDTSNYSANLYMLITKNTRLFYDDDLEKSMPFGYTGVITDSKKSYCFVNIDQDYEWLSEEEMEGAVRNTTVWAVYWGHTHGLILEKNAREFLQKVTQKKNERINDIRKRIKKVKDAASAPQAEVSA